MHVAMLANAQTGTLVRFHKGIIPVTGYGTAKWHVLARTSALCRVLSKLGVGVPDNADRGCRHGETFDQY
jgi:hypothetical protein